MTPAGQEDWKKADNGKKSKDGDLSDQQKDDLQKVTKEPMGTRISEAMEKKKITISGLAKEFGVVSRTISDWKKIGGVPTKNLPRLAKILGLSPGYLLTGYEDAPDHERTGSAEILQFERKLDEKPDAPKSSVTRFVPIYEITELQEQVRIDPNVFTHNLETFAEQPGERSSIAIALNPDYLEMPGIPTFSIPFTVDYFHGFQRGDVVGYAPDLVPARGKFVLIAYRPKTDQAHAEDEFRTVVPKARMWTHKKFLGQNIWIRFPDPKTGKTFEYPHDALVDLLTNKAPTSWLTSSSWNEKGYYHWPVVPSKSGPDYSFIQDWLSKYELEAPSENSHPNPWTIADGWFIPTNHRLVSSNAAESFQSVNNFVLRIHPKEDNPDDVHITPEHEWHLIGTATYRASWLDKTQIDKQTNLPERLDAAYESRRKKEFEGDEPECP